MNLNSLYRLGLFEAAISLGIAALVLGCGSGSGQNTAVVRGKITYNGRPVPTGAIMFTPDNLGPSASGAISADGTYTLSTYDKGDGAVVGTHKVTIMAKEEQVNLEANALATDGKWLIPEKYFLDATSGLTADVKSGQENEINFELTD